MPQIYSITDDNREKIALEFARKNIPTDNSYLSYACSKYNLLSITQRDIEFAQILLSSDVYTYLTTKIDEFTSKSIDEQVQNQDTICRLKKRRTTLVEEIKEKTGYTDVELFS